MRRPSELCELHGAATPRSWSSEWRMHRPRPPCNLSTTTPPFTVALVALVGKRKREERVTAPTSRIMCPALGNAHWAALIAHANAHHRAAFLSVFTAPVLRCVGCVNGTPCPNDIAIDLAALDAPDALAHLHHEQELQVTCDMWRAALPLTPLAWDDGHDSSVQCDLTFGVRSDALGSPHGSWDMACPREVAWRCVVCDLYCVLPIGYSTEYQPIECVRRVQFSRVALLDTRFVPPVPLRVSTDYRVYGVSNR